MEVLPLKGSEAAFDGINEFEMSIEQRMMLSPLIARQFADIAIQLKSIYIFIEKSNAE